MKKWYSQPEYRLKKSKVHFWGSLMEGARLVLDPMEIRSCDPRVPFVALYAEIFCPPICQMPPPPPGLRLYQLK